MIGYLLTQIVFFFFFFLKKRKNYLSEYASNFEWVLIMNQTSERSHYWQAWIKLEFLFEGTLFSPFGFWFVGSVCIFYLFDLWILNHGLLFCGFWCFFFFSFPCNMFHDFLFFSFPWADKTLFELFNWLIGLNLRILTTAMNWVVLLLI